MTDKPSCHGCVDYEPVNGQRQYLCLATGRLIEMPDAKATCPDWCPLLPAETDKPDRWDVLAEVVEAMTSVEPNPSAGIVTGVTPLEPEFDQELGGPKLVFVEGERRSEAWVKMRVATLKRQNEEWGAQLNAAEEFKGRLIMKYNVIVGKLHRIAADAMDERI